MIAVDTSALAAVLFSEPERGAFRQLLETTSRVFISAGTVIELRIVADRRFGETGATSAMAIVDGFEAEIVAVDRAQAEIAMSAFRRFGKGNHRAGLNYGDLFSYALAKSRNLPLLFKGGDFRRTDVTPALPVY